MSQERTEKPTAQTAPGRPREGTGRAQSRPRAGRRLGGGDRSRWPSSGARLVSRHSREQLAARPRHTSATRRSRRSRPATSTPASFTAPACIALLVGPDRAGDDGRRRRHARISGRLVVRARARCTSTGAAQSRQRLQAVRPDAVGAETLKTLIAVTVITLSVAWRIVDAVMADAVAHGVAVAARRRRCSPGSTPTRCCGAWRGGSACSRSATTRCRIPPHVLAEDDQAGSQGRGTR